MMPHRRVISTGILEASISMGPQAAPNPAPPSASLVAMRTLVDQTGEIVESMVLARACGKPTSSGSVPDTFGSREPRRGFGGLRSDFETSSIAAA
jgi:hypothetical protein